MAHHVGNPCLVLATMALLMVVAPCFHHARVSAGWDEQLNVNDAGRRRVLATSTSNSSTEAQILTKFRNGITDPFNALTTWNATQNPNVCRWRGVTCNGGTVSALNLSGHQLVGAISPILGDLVGLSSIDLANNDIYGEVPASLGSLRHLLSLNLSNNHLHGPIPSDISNCSSLRSLQLVENNLTGAIPLELWKLKNISEINLRANNLTSSIPKSLGNCSSLSFLDLSYNRLSGTIPDELGGLGQLSYLVIGANQLTGSIPKSIANCTALNTLDLMNNLLSGEIPAELGMLNNLNHLVLSWNDWTGSIPASLGNLSSLTNLQIANNIYHFASPKLTGRIPSELGNLYNLQFLLIQFTSISGSIPPELGMLSNLTILYLNWNQLTGSIPPALQNLTQLIALEVLNNKLEGEIPGWIGNLGKLGILQLSNNQFNGRIPPEFANLTNMTKFSFSDNSLTGPVPEMGRLILLEEVGLNNNFLSGDLPASLGSCPKLRNLWLQENDFSGPISSYLLSGLTALANLDLSNNRLSGPIPPEVGSSSALTYLDFSANSLTGQIPSQIESLIYLQTINISFNNISGPIPPNISQCKVLNVVDFSNNRLTGQLPIAELEQLKNLRSFNVSNNSLEGAIPESRGSFANVTAADYSGNPGLCGALLGKNCTSSNRECHGKKCKRVWIPIVSSIGGLLVAAVAVTAFCFCVGRKWRGGVCAHVDGERDFGDIPDMSLFTKELTLTMDDLRTATADFSEQNILGVGGQSTVYKAVLPHKDGMIIAVKCVNLDLKGDTKSARDFYHEVRVLGSIRHKHLVKIHGFCSIPSMKALLIEFVPNRSLHVHLHQSTRSSKLSLETRLKIAIGVADAMVYLHHECPKPVIHRDLKPNNILLDFEFNAKVADFGISKFVSGGFVSGEATASGVFGSTGYIAPEYPTSDRVSTKGDVYSFGVVLLELLTGKRPTDTTFVRDGTWLTEWVREASPDRISSILDETVAAELNTNSEYQNLVQKLVQIGLLCTLDMPKDRPSMKDVRQMLEHARDPNAKHSPISNYPTLNELAHISPFDAFYAPTGLKLRKQSAPRAVEADHPNHANRTDKSSTSTSTVLSSSSGQEHDR